MRTSAGYYLAPRWIHDLAGPEKVNLPRVMALERDSPRALSPGGTYTKGGWKITDEKVIGNPVPGNILKLM